MMPGLSDDLQMIDDKRKTAVIDAELTRLQVDIAALQETRLANDGSLQEQQYTFFWKGKAQDERREYGVGFAVKTSLLPMIEPPTDGTERLLSLRLNSRNGPVNFVAVYAPTLNSSPEAKDQFYSELDRFIGQLPQTEDIYLLGDFNARVGTDHDAGLHVLVTTV
ncbi:craniofacial development protein 2-like [Ptychodera flava]|uniref:craniofacial development protein 2-like n=1 Tax=Ptychodera flava TaxID=63121 RepID=UPI00396A01C2